MIRSSLPARSSRAIDPLLTSHEPFDRIGRNPAERCETYRALFRTALDVGFVDGLRAATNGGWALGDARFKRAIADALGRRVAPLARGPSTQGQTGAAAVKSTLTPITFLFNVSSSHFDPKLPKVVEQPCRRSLRVSCRRGTTPIPEASNALQEPLGPDRGA